ncbi:MAG: 1-deoxy-D-xylulose-5-phosphate reductoisomerase, partial [Xanthomonadales bacterium PRO6]|nr:1-deoxy-D-xylulose-5-phosphate reductoisomerase [Xanthomonadales bacterium PRO6]
MKRICLLGATGSIGRSTLDLLARHPQRFCLETVAAGRDDAGLATICREFRPRHAVFADADAASRLRAQLAAEGIPTRVDAGAEALVAAAADP